MLKRKIFNKWLKNLRNPETIARINVRLKRLENGNPGDVESVGDGISELKLDFGPGFRIYYFQDGAMIILLLCGGDKNSQAK